MIYIPHEMACAIDKISGQYVTPLKAARKTDYRCPACSLDVRLKRGEVNRAHFAHNKNQAPCDYYDPATPHDAARDLLAGLLQNNGTLYITAPIHTTTILIIRKTDQAAIITEYVFAHNGGQRRADIAYLETGQIKYIFEVCYTHKTHADDRPEPWFEFSAADIMAADISANEIHLTCQRALNGNLLPGGESLLGCNNATNPAKLVRGKIYIKQRGAGCGKTYESVQYLRELETEPAFAGKDTYIFITKVNSAKDTINKEVVDQLAQSKLPELADVDMYNDTGKHYVMISTRGGRPIKTIIGTVDSFVWAMHNRNYKDPRAADMFKEVVDTIVRKHIVAKPDGVFRFGGENLAFGRNVLIIVDEAQDLPIDYLRAFAVIVAATNVDMCCIGDKLQSIQTGANINMYTSTDVDKELRDNFDVAVVRDPSGVNTVMRFHDTRHMDFVNKLVQFDKYALPEISGICNLPQCRYAHNEPDVACVTLFQTYDTSVGYDANMFDFVCTQIKVYMDAEIARNAYEPNNFMFIMPVLKNKILPRRLNTYLQQYWEDKFNDAEYQAAVSPDVLAKYPATVANRYVVFHEACAYGPTQLNESNNATRIMSIHAAKGTGREVVFLLDMKSQSLHNWTDDLVCESMLHVAVTRQKKALYIGVVCNDDTIHERYKQTGQPIILDDRISIKPKPGSRYTKVLNCAQYIAETPDVWQDIDTHIITPGNYRAKLPSNKHMVKDVVDWGHHTTRALVFRTTLLMQIIRMKPADGIERDNTDLIMNTFDCMRHVKTTIKTYDERNFNSTIKKMCDNLKYHKHQHNQQQIQIGVPVLYVPPYGLEICILGIHGRRENYNVYQTYLKNMMDDLRQSFRNSKLPDTCYIKSAVVCYMTNILSQGQYSDIGILKLYHILDCYAAAGTPNDYCINKKCICINIPRTTTICDAIDATDIKNSTTRHYQAVDFSNKLWKNCRAQLQQTLKAPLVYGDINTIHYIRPCPKNMKRPDPRINMRLSYDIYATSGDYVIDFMIRPSFAELNFSVTISEVLCRRYIHTKLAKIGHRPLITVLLVLGCREPIIFNEHYAADNEHIGMAIRAAMLKQYLPVHTNALAYYHAHINDPNHHGVIEPLHTRIFAVRDTLNIYKDIFPHIPAYFDSLGREYIKRYKAKRDYCDYEAYVAGEVATDVFMPYMISELAVIIDELLASH